MWLLQMQERCLLNTYIYSSEFFFDHNLQDEIVWLKKSLSIEFFSIVHRDSLCTSM